MPNLSIFRCLSQMTQKLVLYYLRWLLQCLFVLSSSLAVIEDKHADDMERTWTNCFLRHKQNLEAETAWNYRNIKNNDLKGAMKCFNDRNWSGPIEGQITNPDC